MDLWRVCGFMPFSFKRVESQDEICADRARKYHSISVPLVPKDGLELPICGSLVLMLSFALQ